jgi:hypothetical protein
MWHGDPGSGRRHVNWARLRAAMDRFVYEQRARQANDNEADACAIRFTERLEEAVLDLETAENGFERAGRKADHVEELRRVLGILLDVLADWEMVAERAG